MCIHFKRQSQLEKEPPNDISLFGFIDNKKNTVGGRANRSSTVLVEFDANYWLKFKKIWIIFLFQCRTPKGKQVESASLYDRLQKN